MSDSKQAFKLKAFTGIIPRKVCKIFQLHNITVKRVCFVKSIAIVIDGYYMEVLIMEEIRVSKKEIIRFRVEEMLRKVNRFIKSFGCRMEVIK